tara:strand:+ start:113 stop:691 length:579 start_codon:yes stop_codon:yes gene_type:complete
MYLLCGLGNPGNRYQHTRHNIGFMVLDKLISKYNIKKYKSDKTKEVYKGSVSDTSLFLLKPLNYMNQSGLPIQSFINYYKIDMDNIIVIHDDLDISLGKIKLKKDGGNGGHKGLISIDEHVGTKYNRLRLGIGHPGSKDLVDNYVLQNFNKSEKMIIETLMDLIAKNLDSLINYKKDLFLNKISEEMKKIIN